MLPQKVQFLIVVVGRVGIYYFFHKHGYEPTGLDGSHGMCNVTYFNTKHLFAPRINIVHSDFIDLKNTGNYFDAIWCMAGLIHVPYKDIVYTMRCILSQLRDGGYGYFSLKFGTEEIDGYYHYNHITLRVVLDLLEVNLIETYISDDASRPDVNG